MISCVYMTPCKPAVYLGGHLILDCIFHITLTHFVTATWALGPDMASAPTNRLEPWISLYMPKKTHKINEKSAKNREKRWQFSSGHGQNNQLRCKVRDPESFFLDWPLFGDPNNSPRLCKCLHCTFWDLKCVTKAQNQIDKVILIFSGVMQKMVCFSQNRPPYTSMSAWLLSQIT